MPGSNQNPGSYRYGYQGQYAEKDPETGLSNFELRMWDARIARWQIPDPESQYMTPYAGMDNNPIVTIDEDGAVGSRFGGTKIGQKFKSWFDGDPSHVYSMKYDSWDYKLNIQSFTRWDFVESYSFGFTYLFSLMNNKNNINSFAINTHSFENDKSVMNIRFRGISTGNYTQVSFKKNNNKYRNLTSPSAPNRYIMTFKNKGTFYFRGATTNTTPTININITNPQLPSSLPGVQADVPASYRIDVLRKYKKYPSGAEVPDYK